MEILVSQFSTDQSTAGYLDPAFRISVFNISVLNIDFLRTTTRTSPVATITIDVSAKISRPKQLPGKSLKEVVSEAVAKDTVGEHAQAREDLARVQQDAGVKRGLKQFRLEAGLSQAELAARLGTSQSYVARLEKGAIANPKLDRLNQISEILDISVDDLSKALNG